MSNHKVLLLHGIKTRKNYVGRQLEKAVELLRKANSEDSPALRQSVDYYAARLLELSDWERQLESQIDKTK